MTKLAEVEAINKLPSLYSGYYLGIKNASGTDIDVDPRSYRYRDRYSYDSARTISLTCSNGRVTDFVFSGDRLRVIAQERWLKDHVGVRVTLDWTYAKDDHTRGQISREYFDGSAINQDPLYEYNYRDATHIPEFVERARAIALADQAPSHYQVVYSGERLSTVNFFDREGKREYHQIRDTNGNYQLEESLLATNPSMKDYHETPIEKVYRRTHQEPREIDGRPISDEYAYVLWREQQNKRQRDTIPLKGNTVVVRGIKFPLHPDFRAIILDVVGKSGVNEILNPSPKE